MLTIQDYTYHLPEDRIAKFPLAERDQSKLLVYRQGVVQHKHFKDIVGEIPAQALMVFNNTKVIPARLHFIKESGAVIELFLLNPVKPSSLLLETMQSKQSCAWVCTIGNLKRWPEALLLHKKIGKATLSAKLLDRAKQLVELSWDSDENFASIVDKAGLTPLPPYLKRDAELSDKERYQTVYSTHDGAVAAPTAGLHFTNHVLLALEEKGVSKSFVTLHVSAGTFQPIKSDNALEHTMHSEQLMVDKATLTHLCEHDGVFIPVGTTSMRTLESLYWMGCKVLKGLKEPFSIDQNLPYLNNTSLPTAKEALKALLNYVNEKNLDAIVANTSIYIHPPYQSRITDALVTNFHQPSSTLLLLIASLIGNDWRKVYDEALARDYRFLSYGDSSLLWKK